MSSIQELAKVELERAGYTGEDSRVMLEILSMFFKQWNSGGAVWAAAPVLVRLLSGLPLTPLTGEADEWEDMSQYAGRQYWQNVRYSFVFRDGKRTWDASTGLEVTFPYMPSLSLPDDPVIVVETEDASNDTGR